MREKIRFNIRGHMVFAIISVITAVLLTACSLTDDNPAGSSSAVPIAVAAAAQEHTLYPIEDLPTPEVLVGIWDHITIQGDAEFIRNAIGALARIRSGSLEMDEKVLRYLHTIKQEGEFSDGLWFFDGFPVYVADRQIYTSSSYFFAGTIVHYAVHSRQDYELYNALLYFFEYYSYDDTLDLAPDLAWEAFWLIGGTAEQNLASRKILADALGYSRFELEQEALEIQIEFMREIGAPRHEILHLEAQIGSIWWDECWGRCLCELHRLRWLLSR